MKIQTVLMSLAVVGVLAVVSQGTPAWGAFHPKNIDHSTVKKNHPQAYKGDGGMALEGCTIWKCS